MITIMPIRNVIALGLTIFIATVTSSHADPRFTSPPESSPRYLAFISDLHLNLGKVDGQWHPYEDFRWAKTLAGFLNEVSLRGNDHVDLVIVGDFLELWQIPDDISCKGDGPGLGCSVAEMERVTTRVIAGHSSKDESDNKKAFDVLREFSLRGENRLHILPGNHDSAVLLPQVWSLVAEALGVESGRINLVGSDMNGIWASSDGRVIAEHGHQMGADLNRYKAWPKIIDDSTGLLIRVEGELNVQKIFNDVERAYPIIDNLSPETKGAWYRMQDRGFWGSAADVAQLISFLLFETSLEHKGDILGGPTMDGRGKIKWQLDYARDTLGYQLFALALPEDDLVRLGLLAIPPETPFKELQSELDILARTLSDEEVEHLCDQLALGNDKARCYDPTLGVIKEALFSSRERIKENHLRLRKKEYKKMRFFIYGHTHQLEKDHPIELNDVSYVTVLNTGAFQRIMDDENYRRRLSQKYPTLSPSDGLSELSLEDDFKACYTAVIAPFEDGAYRPETIRWYMPEGEDGEIVPVGDCRCEWVKNPDDC